jgi:hypothetical protein
VADKLARCEGPSRPPAPSCTASALGHVPADAGGPGARRQCASMKVVGVSAQQSCRSPITVLLTLDGRVPVGAWCGCRPRCKPGTRDTRGRSVPAGEMRCGRGRWRGKGCRREHAKGVSTRRSLVAGDAVRNATSKVRSMGRSCWPWHTLRKGVDAPILDSLRRRPLDTARHEPRQTARPRRSMDATCLRICIHGRVIAARPHLHAPGPLARRFATAARHRSTPRRRTMPFATRCGRDCLVSRTVGEMAALAVLT